MHGRKLQLHRTRLSGSVNCHTQSILTLRIILYMIGLLEPGDFEPFIIKVNHIHDHIGLKKGGGFKVKIAAEEICVHTSVF